MKENFDDDEIEINTNSNNLNNINNYKRKINRCK